MNELNDSIDKNNWEEVYKIINNINADEIFWDHASKGQVAEISYCCWRLLDKFGMYKELDEDFVCDEMGKTLADAYNCYLKRFKDDNDLMCLIGVMIGIIDYPFPVPKGDLGEFEEMGRQMMRDAYANEPNNPLIKCLNIDGMEKNQYSQAAREYINRVLKGCNGIIDYFDMHLEYKGEEIKGAYMKHYNLTNNDENWKYLNKSLEDKNWDFMVKTIENINADETFWDNASKEQVAEISYCCWYLLDYDVGYAANDFYTEVTKTLTGGYNCYLKRFKNDNDLRCLMGYMIAVVDFPFPVPKGDLGEFEEMGRQMLRDAYTNEPNNPLIKCLNTKTAEREPYSEQAKEYLHRIFKDCDGLIEYFDHSLGYKPK